MRSSWMGTPPTRRMIKTLVTAGLVLALSQSARAQEATDPRAAQPERPTVATHAWTVAPRYSELETGFEWDRNVDSSYGVSTLSVLKIGVGRRAQLGLSASSAAG